MDVAGVAEPGVGGRLGLVEVGVSCRFGPAQVRQLPGDTIRET